MPSLPPSSESATSFVVGKEFHMPLPLIAALAGAAIGRAMKKEPKKQAVSKYKKKSGIKVKAYTRKSR
jgi:hypothetical protein